jgi:hypothetical protein
VLRISIAVSIASSDTTACSLALQNRKIKMYRAQKFALGLLAAAAVATASDVVQLKKDTFNDFMKANDLVLAECKHRRAPSPASRILTDRFE